jgi:Saxitoxin biosynthesis operon protein SxtJ
MIDTQLHEDSPSVTGRTLRQFAALCLVILGGMGYWQSQVRGHQTVGAVLGTVGVVLALVGLAKPEAIRPVFSGLVAITLPIGRVVSIVLLGLLFYGVFTPLGLFFRLMGRDPLERARRERASHWTERPAVTDIRSYLRQS